MAIKTILVPVDGSPYVRIAMDHACPASKLFNASITLLHVAIMPVAGDIGYGRSGWGRCALSINIHPAL